MAVKIEMDMPKSCWDCPLQIGTHMEEQCCISRCSTWKNNSKRHERCPLKEIK